jgi:hypothetical protein
MSILSKLRLLLSGSNSQKAANLAHGFISQGNGRRHVTETRSELGQHCFRGMDTRAARCVNRERDIIMETDHEKAQCPWDYRWSGITDCDALLASMVARKEYGAIP